MTALICGYVAALAFLLASFPARNSDVWAHLAAGRGLVQGTAVPAVAPPDALSSRPWLYDLTVYALYSVVGGTGLVLFKALVVAAIGVLLLLLSRTGTAWWVPVACTVLAVLAMATRLFLQPATVSLLLLALVLGSLKKRDADSEKRPPAWLPPWPLALLFVVWVNLDGWFLVGLGVVALAWLGEVLDGRAAGGRLNALARFGCSLLVLAALCLLNPSHVFAFVPSRDVWERAAGLTGQGVSPFQRGYFTGPGLTPAGLAYFPLLGLGLISFLLAFRSARWRRFLPWLGLAVLSAFVARAVPFFAVVAGPVLAWNLQEFLARRAARPRRAWHWRDGPVVLKGIAVMLAAALLVSAWPGWLQAPPYEPRRWGIETAPSLEQGARTLRQWHQEGKLGPAGRGLHLATESANAFAWFCPEEQGLRLDQLPPGQADWGERMHAAGVGYLVLYSTDRGQLFSILDQLQVDPERWPLLYLEGDLAVFGWRDPANLGSGDLFRGQEVDLDLLAFQPAEDRKAPRTRPAQEPEPRHWWEALWKPATARAIDRDEATFRLLHAEALRRFAPYRHLAAWEDSQSAGLVGGAAAWSGPGGLLDATLRLTLLRPRVPAEGSSDDATVTALDRLALRFQQRFTLARDDTPPALLYLAIRAARRAVAANPDDAEAHLVLGQAYLWLLHSTRERSWEERLPGVGQLRRVQASTALNQALALKPDLAQAHLSLAGLYEQWGYLDLALRHHSAYLDLVRRAGPPPGVSRSEFLDQLAGPEARRDELAAVVEEQEAAFAKEFLKLRVLDRALLASSKGLAGKALELLLGTDVSAFGAEGMALEFQLLLRTGRVREVRDWTEPDQIAAMGELSYHWTRAQALAATGDYAAAEEELAILLSGRQGPDLPELRKSVALAASLAIGQRLLDEQGGGELLPHLIRRALARHEYASRITDLGRSLKQESDVAVFQGLIALEAGDVEEAEFAFRTVLALADAAAGLPGGGPEIKGRPIAHECLEWLNRRP